ncbi:type I DNA topoisomerase [Candidatus Falkowbacteria bacterium CG10_big_fil_rev_8_21_14_0_10_37_14]|uniref:DNA topoisomerase 1 n=1 Tax=Candidatus Falkowbacteria bacterium CG10_big_fil_rev_8_21_14_0_10_37_14 TaxID=1974561 RepID=A0A2M6WTM9_9BACT|nr:type I DNA topoisomerase [Candidatus Falkowbacteria bacterium]PIT96142.1 MAG: type I DNA topoisomerase [Candidatus Falkowbacteria bacterium CG10_big_fil_rev_8_21_14_0_10_37_14]
MKLVIVESPTKARTIAKFLGKDYKIESSFGHVRDLPTSTMGIDIENNFEPKYLIPPKARQHTSLLKAAAKQADEIILASDEDREGEAIAWHLAIILGIKPQNAKRIVFHEITKDALLHALENPRHLDKPLFDAQQARRVLDRLVGYELSPFLWKKVARGLSAGRVQSVALRLIVEREKEIKAFDPKEYWKVTAKLKKDNEFFLADLTSVDSNKLDKYALPNDATANNLVERLNKAEYTILEVDKKPGGKKAPTPFRTATLQQTANNHLSWSAKQTMMVAQKLYEKGFITYMRTDSQNLSDKFLTEASGYLRQTLGDKYCLPAPRVFKGKAKGAQEAHEAIRPTEVTSTPDSLVKKLDAREIRLYELIWSRSIASQMPDAITENTTVTINADNCLFTATGQILVFDGFLKIYKENLGDNELPKLLKNDKLTLDKLNAEQHFTKPPARYSDATLVKELEKNGVGRPSTYAPTIATLETRNYIIRNEDKRLQPTDIAIIVTDLLIKHFPEIVDMEFTAKMEKSFDKIAEDKLEWQPVIAKFYKPFHANLENKTKTLNKQDIMPEEKSNEKCDKCGSAMLIKIGRFGKFLACSNYPECKNTKPMDGDKPTPPKTAEMEALITKYATEVCDKCGAPMAVKIGRFGVFLACSSYPKCKNIKNIEGASPTNTPTGLKCPDCGGDIVAKKSRFGIFYGCSNYPTCKRAYWSKPTGEKCPKCGAFLVTDKKGVVVCSNKTCS